METNARIKVRMPIMLHVALLLAAATTPCNEPAERAITHISLTGRPFQPVPTPDGCWIFVSTLGTGPRTEHGIAVVQRSAGRLAVKRFLPTTESLTGMTLTHSGKMLIAGAGNGLLFLDVDSLLSGHGDPILGRITTASEAPSASYLSTTTDDHFLFVSNESSGTISVINLEVALAGFTQQAIVGNIRTGRAPIAVTLSPDDHYLYSTSEVAPNRYGWPAVCQAEQPNGRGNTPHPQGVLMIIDVNRAKTESANSVIGKVMAGCSPVRLALSPKGDRAYVTARGDDSLLIFDIAKLLSDPEHAHMASVKVGPSPVGVAVVDEGKTIVVANSNRFSNDEKKQTLSVIDAATNSLKGTIPAGVFPRELRVTPNQATLLLTNFASKTLELIDLNRLDEILRK